MTAENKNPKRYQNPVFPHSFPDPFVLKYGGEYFAYCTGHWTDGRVFGVLHSRDLINWEPLGSAMAPVDDPAPFYWAPEVTYDNGLFYLYYSMGNETLMHIRVATSDRPDGGFIDSGRRMTSEDFAIDAHLFRDDDGQDYFFYAVDFHEHTHIGTGIVVDKMIDRFTLAGDPRPVVRAKYDWQVYDPARKEKGGVRWHTVEGPFVLKRKGTYFVMFSGGNWQNPSYGVSFASTDDLETNGEWDQFCDGSEVLPILRTYPDTLIGPGHNSVVRGPNNREIYCVYHCWHEGNRVLAVNRMDFIGGRLAVEDQPFLSKSFPYLPAKASIYEEPAANVQMEYEAASGSFLCEASFRFDVQRATGRCGFILGDDTETVFRLEFKADGETLSHRWTGGPNAWPAEFTDTEFRADVVNLIRLEVDGRWAEVRLNGRQLCSGPLLKAPARSLSFFENEADVTWSGVAITEGYEMDLAPANGRRLEDMGWTAVPETAKLSVAGGELKLNEDRLKECLLYKPLAFGSFEFAANIRVISPIGQDASFGFIVINSDGSTVAAFEIAGRQGQFALVEKSRSLSFELPRGFRPEIHHQFKFEKIEDSLRLYVDMADIASIELPADRMHIGIRCSGVAAALEMVRLTAIG